MLAGIIKGRRNKEKTKDAGFVSWEIYEDLRDFSSILDIWKLRLLMQNVCFGLEEKYEICSESFEIAFNVKVKQ